jgi:hypothetical protein
VFSSLAGSSARSPGKKEAAYNLKKDYCPLAYKKGSWEIYPGAFFCFAIENTLLPFLKGGHGEFPMPVAYGVAVFSPGF